MNRKVLTTQAIGSYSELMAAAAFIADGKDVAFPMSNQRGWDLLVQESQSEWLRVQVKTVRIVGKSRLPVVFLRIAGPGRRSAGKCSGVGYGVREADLIVAVHPETGTLWKVPVDAVTGKRQMRLTREFLWVGEVQQVPMPILAPPIPIKRTSRFNLVERRGELAEQIPNERPEDIPEDTWDMLQKWASGYGYGTIGKQYGRTGPAIRERLIRVLPKLRRVG